MGFCCKIYPVGCCQKKIASFLTTITPSFFVILVYLSLLIWLLAINCLHFPVPTDYPVLKPGSKVLHVEFQSPAKSQVSYIR